ncbi:MAG: methylated-DNA--[protein]-cysteine S-methyltransferase [Acidobacteria bacterium]|nr:methylated-DNA--[protein]-cysteine S-methyltransferase [Acidobacteriota bacterium]
MHQDSGSDRRWQAVVARDAAADGRFVYAVRSTRIYCRPSCASRKPAPGVVEFFPDAAAAEASGYRACLRCRPGSPAGASSDAAARVRRVCEAVGRQPDRRWTAGAIARAGGGTVPQVQRAFRTVLGVSPREYVLACRRRRFLEGLRKGQTVTDATYDAGFGSTSRMYGALRLPGMRPATYGRGGRGASIAWTTVPSPLGLILAAATDVGLCFVEVGRSVEPLLAELRREFPLAAIAGAPSDRLDDIAGAVLAVALGRDVRQDVPVDIQGTAFQWRVWRALTAIPRGTTVTYAALAASIGSPSSVRAVGRACATNPIALVVPCHRVIGSDGKLHGFRWGLDVKHALLETERNAG